MKKNEHAVEQLMQLFLYGGEAQKEAYLRELKDYPLMTIPFDSLKLDELMAFLEGYPLNINDWEGNIKAVVVKKCEEASEDELRNAICMGCEKSHRAYRIANMIYEERFEPSSPHYTGSPHDEGEDED
ncbi:MAG: hypothetical protein JXK93_09065 [Sphaerochaetaceae bacterium]|nr:hypothetical protein [Sphaerochaetaceae bacterium]